MKFHTLIFLFFLSISLSAQTVVTTTPVYPTETDQITITFDVTNANPSGKTSLGGYIGIVYAHTGVTLVTNNGAPQRWQKVKGNWGENTVQPQLTNVGTNKYQITINNPRAYYLSGSEQINSNIKITEINFVLRSSDGTKQTEDIFVQLFSPGIDIIINSPTVNLYFGDPMRSPVFVSSGVTLPISVSTTVTGTITLFINGIQKSQSTTNSLNYNFVTNDYSIGRNDIKILAVDNTNQKDSALFVIMRNPLVKNLPLPAEGHIGIHYYDNDPTKTILALYAPQKNFVYVIGEFGNSDWKVDTTFFMNRDFSTADSLWWITIPNLQSGTEYAYQFLIDGSLRLYDPYTDKILDQNNDSSINIPSTVYPNLKTYPVDKTSGLVSVLQPGQSAFNWKVSNFSRPAKEKLVIYEMLIRDFVSTHSYKTLIDTLSYFRKLGVNAIELMPVSEFDANDSWGYNPTTYFAPDKYYGTKDDLKKFIDACHENGIAVIQDMVLNHAYNSNSMAQMYWDTANNRPAANNPWFNIQSNFANPSAQWGNDFNHESAATQYFIDRVLQYWLTEFKVDRFRFDFTKGFGNNHKPATGDDSWGSLYDADRIQLLKRMADKIRSYDPTAILIFEHLAENSEEQELANYGILMWGNMNYNYNEAIMGYVGNSNFGGISYQQRSWSVPNLVGYMESHDEERLMYKNIQYGNSSGSYNIKNLQTALNRIKLAATFFITVPGPKMIWQFGELGYDKSIDFNGRLGKKPVPWADGLNYYSNADRKSLFNTFAALIRLKKNYPAFSSTDFSLSTSAGLKRIKINHSSMNVVIIGNFDVTSGTVVTDFQNTGKWFELFSGDSLDVTDVGMQINLQPGEYRLYTSIKLPSMDFLVDVKESNEIPKQFSLEQNYPNPFNPETVISYQLAVSSYVTLKVYDLLGREVATLVNEFKQAGVYNSQFSIRNLPAGRQGLQLSSGVYFYRLQAGNPSQGSGQGFVQTKKMLLLK